MISIPVSQIETINVLNSPFNPESFSNSLRNRGIFGYTGTAELNGIHTRLFTKRKKDNIIITCKNKQAIMLSPDDIYLAIELIEAVQKANS